MGEVQNKLILLEYLARGICWRINNLCARGNISLSLFSRIPYIRVTRFKLPVFQALKASRKLFPDGLTTRKKEHYDYTVNAKSANAKHNYADWEPCATHLSQWWCVKFQGGWVEAFQEITTPLQAMRIPRSDLSELANGTPSCKLHFTTGNSEWNRTRVSIYSRRSQELHYRCP